MVKTKNKKSSSEIPWWVIVIAIALIILTLGWFIHASKTETREHTETDEQRKRREAETSKREKEILRQKLLKEKNERLEIVKANLITLLRKKDEIMQKEKRIFYQARGILSISIILINGIYFYIWNWPLNLDAFLQFNELVLLSYSFFAFFTYGTPSNLVKGLKEKIALYLKRKNIHTIEEIEALKEEQKILIKEIEELNQLDE